MDVVLLFLLWLNCVFSLTMYLLFVLQLYVERCHTNKSFSVSLYKMLRIKLKTFQLLLTSVFPFRKCIFENISFTIPKFLNNVCIEIVTFLQSIAFHHILEFFLIDLHQIGNPISICCFRSQKDIQGVPIEFVYHFLFSKFLVSGQLLKGPQVHRSPFISNFFLSLI